MRHDCQVENLFFCIQQISHRERLTAITTMDKGEGDELLLLAGTSDGRVLKIAYDAKSRSSKLLEASRHVIRRKFSSC